MNTTILYDTLSNINVYNWFCGNICALYAWSNNCIISKNDIKKVRYHIKKIGYGLHAYNGIIYSIYKL